MDDGVLNFDLLTGVVSVAALLGMILLVPLYLSQRRDVQRLRRWMEAEPDHPLADMAASESLLDRAEQELEELYAELGEPVTDTGEAVPVTAVRPPDSHEIPAHARVTGERPALTRITMERAALEPHPRYHRFLAKVGQPKWLAALAVGALLVGAAGILVTERLLESDSPTGETGPSGLDPATVEVAVLNATANGGLGGATSAEVQRAGFVPGAVGNLEQQQQQSVVMYERNNQAAANLLAHKLDIKPRQPISAQAQELAEGADVVVVVGEDRAQD